jgi:chemotaxis protein methyltransferase CheR
MGRFSFRNLRLQASDIDEGGNFGQVIAEGAYSWAEVERVPAELLARYFTPLADGRYRVSDELRGKVAFQRHDLTSLDSLGSEFSLIVCKNVLLHFDAPMRERVLEMFHASLQAGGLLVMEHTQKLPAGVADRFERVAPEAELYRRR